MLQKQFSMLAYERPNSNEDHVETKFLLQRGRRAAPDAVDADASARHKD